MMYWVSEEFYLSFVVTRTCLSLSPFIVGKLGQAVKGVCSCWDWQLISGLIWLTILLSVATSVYSWGSA